MENVKLILDISIFSWLKVQKYSWEVSAYISKVKMLGFFFTEENLDQSLSKLSCKIVLFNINSS